MHSFLFVMSHHVLFIITMCYYQSGASCKWEMGRVKLSFEYGACLGASFVWGEFSLGRVVLHPSDIIGNHLCFCLW